MKIEIHYAEPDNFLNAKENLYVTFLQEPASFLSHLRENASIWMTYFKKINTKVH